MDRVHNPQFGETAMTELHWDVVVVGGANWDYMVQGPHLPKAGETVTGEQFHEAAGGKGANQAIAVARLGARVAFVGRVGKDSRGDQILQKMANESVNVDYVVRDEVLPTGIALIMVDSHGEKQILTASGANGFLGVTDIDAARDAIQRSKVVLTQLEIPIETVERTVALASDGPAQVLLDPAPAQKLSDELLRRLHVLRANANEAEVLTGVPVSDRDSAREAAKALMRRGVKNVIVQGGSDGNLAMSNGDEHWLPKIRVPSVDATGAGDAFCAALAVMLAEGKSLFEAAKYGSAAAALKTTVVGAQAGLPRRETILALLATQDAWQTSGA
jgi:ribokinase